MHSLVALLNVQFIRIKAVCCAVLPITIVILPSNAAHVITLSFCDCRLTSHTFHAQGNCSIAMEAVLEMGILEAAFRELTSQTQCAILPNPPMLRFHMDNIM